MSSGENFRLDFQGYAYGDEFRGCDGLSRNDKFVRYEIQKDEKGKTSIAHVCLPVDEEIKGDTFVNAFVRSMTEHGQPQKIAIIRKV